MTKTRTKTILTLVLSALLVGAGLGAPQLTSAQTTTAASSTYSDQIRTAVNHYVNAERDKAITEVALERALAEHAAGQITDAQLQRVRDQDARKRFAYNAAITEYRAAVAAARPDVPMPSDVGTYEAAVRRALTQYLAAARADGLAQANLDFGVLDLDAQRIDGIQLQVLRDAKAATQGGVDRALIEMRAAWHAIDPVYASAVNVYQNAENERIAAERAAEAARLAQERAAQRAAERAAEAARVAEARAAAARDAEARRAAEARAEWERARRARATVPTATAANGQGSVVVRPTASAPGKGGETCPVTGASAGFTATVRVAVR
ncbi:MAG: hypothetical protein H6719_34490 [Sandaracinaceae bacterium]|nr:hypothetical protein [Sandaracinaceae bacterium]